MSIDDDILRLDDEALQREMARQVAIHERIKEAGAFSLFQPKTYQLGWFQTAKKITSVIKPSQVGGTTCLVIRMIASCVGTMPLALGGLIPADWNQLRVREKPGKFLLMGQSFSKSIPEVILPKLKEFIAPEMLSRKPKKNQMGIPYLFSFKSGAELHLASYDQDPDSFEGSLWNGVGFDEPPPEPIYTACRRGTMRTEGWMMFSMTPLKELWVYDQIHLPGMQGKRNDVAAFEVGAHANCIQCNPEDGFIEHDELVAFFAHLSPKERQARELGIPIELSDLMFSFVKPETHVVANMW